MCVILKYSLVKKDEYFYNFRRRVIGRHVFTIFMTSAQHSYTQWKLNIPLVMALGIFDLWIL